MVIFWRLVLVYLINTFVFQFNFLKYWKNYNLKQIIICNFVFLAISGVFVFPFLDINWFELYGLSINGWTSLIFIFIFFVCQDIWRNYTLKYFKNADNILYFLWDQFIHIGVIFAFSPISGFKKNFLLFDEKTIILACIFLTISYVFTVLIYFAEKSLYGNANIPSLDQKYFLMMMRVVFWLLFLIPGYYWIVFLIVWLAYSVYLKRKRIMDFSRFSIYTGFILTAIVAAFTRYIYFY